MSCYGRTTRCSWRVGCGFLFDLPLPILALLLIAAWRERDRALAELSRLSVTDALTGAASWNAPRHRSRKRSVPAYPPP